MYNNILHIQSDTKDKSKLIAALKQLRQILTTTENPPFDEV